MHWILLLFMTSIAVDASRNSTYRGYHRTIGIPVAERIWEIEKQTMKGVSDDGINSRIIGGTPTTHYRYPWLAGLLIYQTYTTGKWRSVCSGSLLNPIRVLTAAHCWRNVDFKPDYMEAVLGSDYIFYGGTRIKTTKVVNHPKYMDGLNLESRFNVDAAVVFLPVEVKFSSTIKPIALPINMTKETFERYTAHAAGYGNIRSVPRLKAPTNYEVDLIVVSNFDCRSDWRPKVVMCTSGYGIVGACNGDSGGPLSVRVCGENILIGIMKSIRVAADCESGYPTFHTRVTEILPFIIANLDPDP